MANKTHKPSFSLNCFSQVIIAMKKGPNTCMKIFKLLSIGMWSPWEYFGLETHILKRFCVCVMLSTNR